MRRDEALQKYFEDFMYSQFPEFIGKEEYQLAYPATAVPEVVSLPYMTYDVLDADWLEGDVHPVVNLWFRTESESLPNHVAGEFKKYIEQNDTIVCEDGYIWVKPGSPWCSSIADEHDPKIKRRYINIDLEYLTKRL